MLQAALTESPPLAEAPARPQARGRMVGAIAVLLIFWGILVNQLRLDWELNPQYSYGWLVPFLAAYLAYARWPSRPEAAPLRGSAAICAGIGLLALLFFPTRLIREATPDWSAVSWALALEVAGITLLSLAYAGGWRLARHFAWPVCFFFIGVAWPVRFETALTQDLMQRLAAITAELLNWAGVSASPQGNLIRLSAGVVGVDEACSGVRSLQSMIMASLFLGELYRFSLPRRVVLIALGLGFALFFNIVRAMLLVTIAVRDGIPALEKWHDPAGFSILALSFGALCVVVWLFRKPAPAGPPPSHARPWRPLPLALVGALAAWIVLSEAATEVWYRSHESPAAQLARWSVRWPEQAPGFKNIPIPGNVTKVLACNEGREAAWQMPDGSQWQMFAFEWFAGRTSTLSARLHRPEVCLPAGGRTLRREMPPTLVRVGALEIPFRVYQFDNQGRALFVFFCLWEIGNRDLANDGALEEVTRGNRLRRVQMGQRNLGQQSVEVVVSGLETPEEATAAFQQLAARLIVPS